MEKILGKKIGNANKITIKNMKKQRKSIGINTYMQTNLQEQMSNNKIDNNK